MSNSIYWYDYETFGINPRMDRLAQFAGIRTDEALNVISDPLMIYCKPANDMLPDPQSCLITGITPQRALADGLPEAEFITAIHKEFAKAGTCVAGFNNIRFDDEFTRNALYRNFFNPYAHEWQHGNSRWDIIDMVRMTRALRPEGITWPEDNGKPTIRLERLTKENGIEHEAAHDAMSDVYATIAVAKLIRDKQPRLYEYIYSLRKKNKVSELLNLRTHEMILHASSRYSPERGAIAMVMPLCVDPSNKNGIVVYDLSVNPQDFLDVDANELNGRIFTRSDELPEGVERIALKTIHINKCPAIAPAKTMDTEAAQRLAINNDICETNRQIILQNLPALVNKINIAFTQQSFPQSSDPEEQLYSGGFFSSADNNRMEQVRACLPKELNQCHLSFDDNRLPEMLFRYKARNFPESLNDNEIQQWNEFRQKRLTDPAIGPRTINQFTAQITDLQASPDTTGDQLVILEDLLAYAKDIL